MYYEHLTTKKYIPELVTIIIPNYNEGDKLLRAVISVQNQTYKQIEIIVADDGSTDNSISLVKEKNIKNLKVLLLDHTGHPNFPRNEAIKISNGEYIGFLDADDVFVTTKIEKQIDYFKKNQDYDVLYCDSKIGDSNLSVKTESWFKDRDRMVEGDIFNTTLNIFHPKIKGFQLSPEWLLIKRSVLSKTGLMSTKIKFLSDWDFGLRLASVSKIGCIKESLTIQDRGNDAVHYSSKFQNQFLENPYSKIEQVLKLLKSFENLTNVQKQMIKSSIPHFLRTSAIRQTVFNNHKGAYFYLFSVLKIEPLNYKNYILLIKILIGHYKKT